LRDQKCNQKTSLKFMNKSKFTLTINLFVDIAQQFL